MRQKLYRSVALILLCAISLPLQHNYTYAASYVPHSNPHLVNLEPINGLLLSDSVPPDTVAIYTAGNWEEQEVYALRRNGQSQSLDLKISGQAKISPSGCWLAFLNKTTHSVQVVNFETGSALSVDLSPPTYVAGFAFDVQEKYLAISGDNINSSTWFLRILNLVDGTITSQDLKYGAQSGLQWPLMIYTWSYTLNALIVQPYVPGTEPSSRNVIALHLTEPPQANTIDLQNLRELGNGNVSAGTVRLSPDGTHILYLGRNRDYRPENYTPMGYDLAVNELWEVDLSSGLASNLVNLRDGSALARTTAWSLDGTAIGYVDGWYVVEKNLPYDNSSLNHLTLKTVELGGTQQELRPLLTPGELTNLAWCTEDTMIVEVFGDDGQSALYNVPITEGEISLIVHAQSTEILGCVTAPRLDPEPYLQRKSNVIPRLEETELDVFTLILPMSAFDEELAKDLLKRLDAASEVGDISNEQIEALGRLVVQEEGLSELLALYTQTSADMTEVATDVVGLLLGLLKTADDARKACDLSGTPFSLACQKLHKIIAQAIVRVIDQAIRLAIRHLPDPQQREEIGELWTLLINAIRVELDAGAVLEELLLGPAVRRKGTGFMIDRYVEALQPSINQGVHSADFSYTGTDPIWAVIGKQEIAELHIKGIVEQATIRAEYAHSAHEDLMKGANVAELIGEVSDLASLTPLAALAEIPKIVSRVGQLLVDAAAYRENAYALDCTRYLSEHTGPLAFNPDQPGENCVYMENETSTTQVNPSAWEDLLNSLEQEKANYTTALEQTLQALEQLEFQNPDDLNLRFDALDEVDHTFFNSLDYVTTALLSGGSYDQQATEVLAYADEVTIKAVYLYALMAQYLVTPQSDEVWAEIENAKQEILTMLEDSQSITRKTITTSANKAPVILLSDVLMPNAVMCNEEISITTVIQNIGTHESEPVTIQISTNKQPTSTTTLKALTPNESVTHTYSLIINMCDPMLVHLAVLSSSNDTLDSRLLSILPQEPVKEAEISLDDSPLETPTPRESSCSWNWVPILVAFIVVLMVVLLLVWINIKRNLNNRK